MGRCFNKLRQLRAVDARPLSRPAEATCPHHGWHCGAMVMSAISSGRVAGGSQAPVQGGLGDAGLGADLAVALALATSLNNLSVRLGDLGRREEALAAIEEAVTVRRELAARWPDAYEQELKQSLQVVAWL